MKEKKQKKMLEEEIRQRLASGWQVESDRGDYVILKKGTRVRHLLHLVLSVVSLGIWIPIWAVMFIFGGEKRRRVWWDETQNCVQVKVVW